MMKPKVLIACDYPGWAYDNVSNAIIQALCHVYDFYKIYTKDLPIIDYHDFDVIYCMWWRTDFLERNYIPKEKLCIQVASFWSWQNKYVTPLGKFVDRYLNRACCVSVNCPGLYDLISPLHNKVFLNPSGVDTNMFHFNKPKTYSNKDDLTVGWAGSTSTHGDNKGLYDIVYPACESIDNVILKLVTKENDWLPHVNMPSFYKDIDVYLCASRSEGTPNPVLEAAASGRAVVSTAVGIVPMLIKNGYNGYIVNRSIESITTSLMNLRDNRILCIEMGKNNRKTIIRNRWDWHTKAKNYQAMFDYVLGE